MAVRVLVHSKVKKQFISPDQVIAELEQKARECDERAEKAADSEAAALREEADKCRNWVKMLGSGRWTA